MECCRTKLQISAVVGLSSLAILPPLIRAAIAPETETIATRAPQEIIQSPVRKSAALPGTNVRRRDGAKIVTSRRIQSIRPARQSTGRLPDLPVRSSRPPAARQVASLPRQEVPIIAPAAKPRRTASIAVIPQERHPKPFLIRSVRPPVLHHRKRPLAVASLPQPTEAFRLPKIVVPKTRTVGLAPLARHPEPFAVRETPEQPKPFVVASLPPMIGTPRLTPKDEAIVTVPLPRLSPRSPGQTEPQLARLATGEPEASDDATPAPYIPWAQRQASIPRAGPIHGNPHLAPHVAPFRSKHEPGTIVVHVEEKRLYLVESPATARVYPIGTAKGNLDILGRTSITTRRFMPTWTPTPNQRERDPTLPKRVEAGPDNPLGIRAMGLGWRYRLIHGTSDPSSIGFARSDGCIRMLNDDVADLYRRVRVGNEVVVLASAKAKLVETRPPGFEDYSPYWKRKIARSVKRARARENRRYASRKKRRRRR